MPRLAKGGKWTYGWVVVGPEGKVTIPPEAWREFGFEAGGEAILLPGSRRSGGFGVSTPEWMSQASERLGGGAMRELGRGQFGECGQVVLPSTVDVKPGDRLLAVRGSRYALGFVARGPVYETALKHPELKVFEFCG
jgi:hypothetical protein